jgi:hypothetical protein
MAADLAEPYRMTHSGSRVCITAFETMLLCGGRSNSLAGDDRGRNARGEGRNFQAVLLTPQKNGSGPCAMPLTFFKYEPSGA